MKTRVAMLFGGKSVEHEVSVISGIQAVMNMDKIGRASCRERG